MQKIFLVGYREFIQRARSRGFWASSLLMPVFLIFFWLFTGVFETEPQEEPDMLEGISEAQAAAGYVDQADLIRTIPQPLQVEDFRSYPDVETADSALRQGEIQAYYLVPQDYRQSGELRRVSLMLPASPPDVNRFNYVLVSNLVPDATQAQVSLLSSPLGPDGPQFITLTPEGEAGPPGNPMLPFIVAFAIMIPLFTSGSYLLQSLTQEKSSRVMEILLASLRPFHLLAGKLVGLGVLTLVQYLLWGLIAGAMLLVTGQEAVSFLAQLNLSVEEVVLIVPFALGGFLLYAGIMAGIGALSSDLESSRGWIFIVTLPMLIPIYLWVAITNDPNGILSLALSLFPFSAPVTMLMRMTTTSVPTWQLAASLALLLVTAVGMVWLMARLFRVQTLLSGESFSIRRLWSALQG